MKERRRELMGACKPFTVIAEMGIERAMGDQMSALIRGMRGAHYAGILVYHRIGAGLFEAHVARLQAMYNIVSLDQLVDAVRRRDWSGMAPRSLVITFDDGWRGFAALEPVIRRFRLPVTQYLVSDGVGSCCWFNRVPGECCPQLKSLPNEGREAWLREHVGYEPKREYPNRDMLNLDEIRRLEDAGVQFGAHTVTHPELPMCDGEAAWQEISQSKQDLERMLGCEVKHFAYPSGSFTNRDAELVRKAGFLSARTMRRGWNSVKTDPYRLRDLGPGDDLRLEELGYLELLSLARRVAKFAERIRSGFRLQPTLLHGNLKQPVGKGNRPRGRATQKKELGICFVAQNAYGALTGTDNGHVGGIEHQQSLMAKWFAARGYDVSMVTWDEGQGDTARVAGVRVIPLCRRDAGLPGLRFIHPRWSSLWRALARADADVYYYNCGEMGLGQVVMWCRRHGRKCIYSVASELDCDAALPKLRPIRERVLYRYGLQGADRIIVQTKRQQRMLQDGFGRNSVVIPMPCPQPEDGQNESPQVPSAGSARVLWVGRISEEKRLEWLLDVAERCPDLAFDVVGASNDHSGYASGVIRRAQGVGNVTLHGRALHEEMRAFYRRANVLCCTSAYEGFPNTFLEAWSHGVPVVSTFDPDDVIGQDGLGEVAGDLDGLVAKLRGLLSSAETSSAASARARQYYLRHHTPDACMTRFEQVFLQLASKGTNTSPGEPLN